MNYNKEALKEACLKVAKNELWDTKPFDATVIKNLAEDYYRIASDFMESIDEDLDPNIVIRAIHYIADTSIPCGGNIDRFNTSLMVLMELACPNTGLFDEAMEFLNDIEDGIAESRAIG